MTQSAPFIAAKIPIKVELEAGADCIVLDATRHKY
jgi:hypothetical protein